MSSKKYIFLTSIACLVCLAVISLFTFGNFLNQKASVQVQYDTQVIKVEDFDYTSLLELFDNISIDTDDKNNSKIVNTDFKLNGTSLNNVIFTANGEEENVSVCGTTTINQSTNISKIEIVLDYGEAIDYIFANSTVHFDENGNPIGKIVLDGVEYDVNEVLNAMYGENGIQECWFWFIIKIVLVIVNVAIAAITAVDIYKYLTTEEVTLEGVLCIVAEGMVMAAASAVGSAIAVNLIKSGVKLIKNAKKMSKSASVLLGRNIATFDKECINLIKQGKKNIKHSCNTESQLRNIYKSQKEFKSYNWTNSSKDDYVQIHHFVEQRQAPQVFANNTIHTDLNTVGVSKALHGKISALYSSKSKYDADITKIFGKGYFDGKTSFRDFVGTKSFEEQYEIGIKIFEYFQKQGNNFVLRL